MMLAIASARRSREAMRARTFDVVWVHRCATLVGPAWIERLIAARTPLVFDFDDAIYLLDSTAANRGSAWLKFPGKTSSVCRMSRHVVVGNDHLGDFARRFNDRVSVVPSSIDTELYRARTPHQRKDSITVGWMGSATSQSYLESFAPVLRRIQKERPVEVRVVSDLRPDLPGLRFEWREWNAGTEVEELSGFDIGIMPLRDDEWSRGKCAMKALQYMGVGVPVVCSAVGANRDLVEHGRNGFKATTEDEWVTALACLADDAELRSEVGAAGRRTVEQRFSAARCANLMGDVFRSVVASDRETR